MSVGSTGGEAVKEVCPHCRGTGTLSCPKTVKCPKCHGVGYFIEICPECHGEKRVTCQTCNGKGFTGKPQPDPPEPEKVKKNEGIKDAGHSFFTPPVIVP
jgi:DnaJ-class molecular chaperone